MPSDPPQGRPRHRSRPPSTRRALGLGSSSSGPRRRVLGRVLMSLYISVCVSYRFSSRSKEEWPPPPPPPTPSSAGPCSSVLDGGESATGYATGARAGPCTESCTAPRAARHSRLSQGAVRPAGPPSQITGAHGRRRRRRRREGVHRRRRHRRRRELYNGPSSTLTLPFSPAAIDDPLPDEGPALLREPRSSCNVRARDR